MEIDSSNKKKIAIVVIGYNRIKAISRLLACLNNAEYPSNDIPLVISIDCSKNEELYEFVRNFQWLHGDKFVNIQEERLGLRNHIFQCASLSSKFRAVILLEDDLFLSPYFYQYVQQAVDKYENDDRVAEIALYTNEMNGYTGLPFSPLQNGSDTFLMQDVCTSGECFTEKMWQGFQAWLSKPENEDISMIDMQPAIKTWTKAWSKFYNAYVVSQNLHVVYPRVAVSTNFNDVGTHGTNEDDAVTQINLSEHRSEYRMYDYDSLITYDIYNNNEALYEWLHLSREELCLDLYGTHDNPGRRYILSTRYLPYETVDSFALSMKPIELNIKYGIKGDGIYLYDTTIPKKVKKEGAYTDYLTHYFLHGFNSHLIVKEACRILKQALKRKLSLRK